MHKLRAVRDVCASSARRYAALADAAHTRAAGLRARELDADTVLVATNLAENQLVGAVAHDRALGDAMHQVLRACAAERLPLAHMLKHSRALAREQFAHRALARRIGDGLGWTM